MKKLAALIFISIILAACSEDYSGEYEHKFKTKKAYYVNPKTGEETTQIDQFMAFIAPEESRVKYNKVIKEVDSKMVLSLKQEKSKVTGSMSISNEFNVTKFDIEAGEVNAAGLLHLKLVTAIPLGSPGVAVSIFSFSTPMETRIQLNLNQEQEMSGSEILFKISSSSNIPLFSSNTKNETVAFMKR